VWVAAEKRVRRRISEGFTRIAERNMDQDRAHRVAEIERRIRRGEYTVDPREVADALLRRRPELAAASSLRSDARIRTASRTRR
jgi:hypothetical protein